MLMPSLHYWRSVSVERLYPVTFNQEVESRYTLPCQIDHDFAGSVYENEPPGTSILTVKAQQQNAEIEYYVTNITTTAGKQVTRLFDIDTKLGILSTAQVLDREAGAEMYDVEVYAIVVNTDTSQTSKTKVRVYVIFFQFDLH